MGNNPYIYKTKEDEIMQNEQVKTNHLKVWRDFLEIILKVLLLYGALLFFIIVSGKYLYDNLEPQILIFLSLYKNVSPLITAPLYLIISIYFWEKGNSLIHKLLSNLKKAPSFYPGLRVLVYLQAAFFGVIIALSANTLILKFLMILMKG
jgi:hypothetical protein